MVDLELLKHTWGSFRSLEALDAVTPEPGRFRVDVSGLPIDCLYLPGSTPDLWVFFSGARQSDHGSRPLFQRWRWKDTFPGHALYIADPTFTAAQDSLFIGWYFGRARNDATKAIAALIERVASRLGVPPGRVFLYGSSAGGFASLSIGSLLPHCTAVAINPQTDIHAYYRQHANRFLKAMALPLTPPDTPRLAERLSVFERVRRGVETKYLIVQNRQDEFHRIHHFAPFCRALGVPEEGGRASGRAIESLLYDSENGHGAEPLEVVAKIVDTVLGGAKRPEIATLDVERPATRRYAPEPVSDRPAGPRYQARVLPFSGAPMGDGDLPAGLGPAAAARHHLVVTRYFLQMFAPASAAERSDAEIAAWFERRQGLFEDYTLPSLLQQSATLKTWLLFVEARHARLLPSSLRGRDKPPFVKIVEIDSSRQRFPDFSQAIGEQINVELERLTAAGHARPLVVVSRIDNDDAFSFDHLETAGRVAAGQRQAGVEAGLISFPHGLQWRKGEGVGTYLSNNNHFVSSFHSNVQSPARHIHPLAFNHTTLFKQPLPVVTVNTDRPMWLETVHGDNVLNRPRSVPGAMDAEALRQRFGCRWRPDAGSSTTALSGPGGPAPTVRTSVTATWELERLLAVQAEAKAMKPASFLRAYAQVLGGASIGTLLEIGVHQGGSLKFWRGLLGDRLKLYGLDIKPECAKFAPEPANEVFIGSQVDFGLLDSIAARCGPFDVIIDDGSHRNEHMWDTFIHLFPALRPGGIYVIEDAFTSYWDAYGGGLRHPDSLVERSKHKIDEVFSRFVGPRYAKHHRLPAAQAPKPDALAESIASIEFHRAGLVVFRRVDAGHDGRDA